MVEHEGESIYEEISVNIDAQLRKKLQENHKCLKEKTKRNGFLRWPLSVFGKGKEAKPCLETCDKDKDNIYECIPVKLDQQIAEEDLTPTQTELDELYDEEYENDSNASDTQEYVVVTKDEFPASPSSEIPSDEAAEYAVIVTRQKLPEISPASRPTRTSDNPILREDFAMLEGYQPPEENLTEERISIRDRTEAAGAEYVNAATCRSTRNSVHKRELSHSDSTPHDALYENASQIQPGPSPEPGSSPVSTQIQTSSGPVYENTESALAVPACATSPEHSVNYENIPLPARPTIGRCYSLPGRSYAPRSSSKGRTETSSVVGEEGCGDVLYENTNDGIKPRKSSKPIDILIYSDLDFAHLKARDRPGLSRSHSNSSSYDTCSISSVATSSSSGSSNSSPVLPRRSSPTTATSVRQFRDSLNCSASAFGVYSGKFVGSVPAHRSNIQTIECLIRELASRYEEEKGLCVNIEATSDVLRVSTKSAPYDVVVSAEVDSVECIAMNNVRSDYVGFIVGGRGKEAVCYVLHSTQAVEIHEAVKAAFRSSPPKVRSAAERV